MRTIIALILALSVTLALRAATQDELNAALHAAIPGGDVAAVKAALAAGADINAPDGDGWPALLSAVEFNKIAVVDALLAAGAAVDARDTKQGTSLHLAVFWGWPDIVKTLLAHHADPNARDENGDTPLFRLNDDAETIGGMLVSAGAKIDATNNEGRTALHVDSMGGGLDAIKFLLSHNADVSLKDLMGRTPADLAIDGGQAEALALLLATEKGKASVTDIDAPDEDMRTRLHRAAFDGNAQLAQRLLAAGAAVDAREKEGATPLLFAVAKGNDGLVTLLLENGADVNAQLTSGLTSVDIATRTGRSATLKILTDRGGITGQTLVLTRMREAMKADDPAAVGALMDQYPALAQVTDLLTTAADACSPAVVKVLLLKGCNVNAASPDGWTALHTAAARNSLEMVHILLAHKADPNIEETKNHWTALDVAVFEKHKEVADAIRAAGGKGVYDEANKIAEEFIKEQEAKTLKTDPASNHN